MSASSGTQTTSQPQWPAPMTSGEWCPLCGCALDQEQDWCLHCGAAARTRLAATPRWRAPILSVAIVIVTSLGIIIAALVKLTG